MTQWISLKERVPTRTSHIVYVEHMEYFLVTDGTNIGIHIWNYIEKEFSPSFYIIPNRVGKIIMEGITHWMPLPQLPEDDA